jgi:glucosamine kinase
VISGLRLLGLDIGGTKSRAQLWAAGEIVATSEAASASPVAAGSDGAKAALADLLAQLRLDAAGPLDAADRLDAVCAGTAGLSVPGTEQFLYAQLAPLTRSGTVVIVSDAMLLLSAAGLDEGVAVVCGTGSVAVGVYRNRTTEVGGWGYLLGDEGSGYWIVREALRALLARRDQGSPPGELGNRLLAATGADDLAELQRSYYEQPHVPRRWATHAPLVLDSADPTATDITRRAADAVAALAAAASQHLDSPGSLPVVLAGGLLANAAFRHAASGAVEMALPAAAVRVLAEEPVAGAIRLARRAVEADRPAADRSGADG